MNLRVPRVLLLVVCAELTALAYYLILFTNYGNLYFGRSYGGVVLTEAIAVLAVFACAEVMRTEKLIALRALAGALGAPLLAATLLMFWIGLRRFLEM
jgi:hypothetical protein